MLNLAVVSGRVSVWPLCYIFLVAAGWLHQRVSATPSRASVVYIHVFVWLFRLENVQRNDRDQIIPLCFV